MVTIATFLLSAFSLTHASTGGYPYSDSPTCASGNCVADPWRFYKRECTSFVAWKLNTINQFSFKNDFDNNGTLDFGNADRWGSVARKFGYSVNMIPAVGAVAWWDSTHVAWVEAVNGDRITIQEYNYGYTGNYNSRVINRTDVSGYIHFKDIGKQNRTLNTDFNRDGTPDIYAIQRNDTGSNSTAVRIVNGTNVNQWLLQTGTILPKTGPETDFAVDDFNGDGIPDIYSIQRNDVSSNSTAIRIVNGANPKQWLLQTSTVLPQTDDTWSFALGDYNKDNVPDIYAFQRNDSSTGKTAVHIINGANPRQWLLQTPLVLGTTGQETEFAVGDYNNDNVPDIYTISRNDAGSNSTAVRIINGADVNQWLLQTGTILGTTSQNWDFRLVDLNKDGKPDLYAFDRNDFGSNKTSVRIINGSDFRSWLLQSGTVIPPTSLEWSFS